MLIEDRAVAAKTLARVNYYRLSGYWYPFRVKCEDGRADDFYPGTRFNDVVVGRPLHSVRSLCESSVSI
ncbi:Abi family protein [Propionibacterium freudenreichii]|nr:Abi family protein [Propionibacterium freudenreichii]